MILDDFVNHPFCQGNIVAIADAVGQIQPSFILRRVVDDVVGGQMGIWDDNAFVVDCIQGGVHKSNLRNLAGNGFQLNEIAALEGLADEDLKPAGKLGDAVLQAKAFVGNEPFVVMLGDDLMDITNDKAVPLTKQLIDDYEATHASTIAVMQVPHDEVSSYGVIAPQGEGVKGLYSVETFVEKPKPEDAPSDLAIIGRYLLTPEIFEILEKQAPGAGNEIQLTDAIDTLNKTQRVFAREFKGDRYDVGDKFGFMKTSIDYALKHPQVKDSLKQYIIDLGHTLEKKQSKK